MRLQSVFFFEKLMGGRPKQGSNQGDKSREFRGALQTKPIDPYVIIVHTALPYIIFNYQQAGRHCGQARDSLITMV